MSYLFWHIRGPWEDCPGDQEISCSPINPQAPSEQAERAKKFCQFLTIFSFNNSWKTMCNNIHLYKHNHRQNYHKGKVWCMAYLSRWIIVISLLQYTCLVRTTPPMVVIEQTGFTMISSSLGHTQAFAHMEKVQDLTQFYDVWAS